MILPSGIKGLSQAMKKLSIFLSFVALLTWSSGCEKGFDELNVNPTAATTLNPIFTFNNAIVNSAFTNDILVFELGIVQQMYSPNSGVLAGANFNVDNKFRNAGLWQRYNRDVLRYVVDVLDKTKAEPTRSNLYNMARIWRAHTAMVLTDTYGDVPYKEAGLGFLGGSITPKYDTQQSIYEDILKELPEAAAALDATKTREAGDILYGGDIAKWKKLANSLLLRAGMRLSKVNPALAQSTVQKAVAGGVFQTNADNAVVRHTSNFQNSVSGLLNGSEANNYYLTGNFVDYLKATEDPRLASIAARYVGAKSGSEQTAAKINRDPAVQIGMPLGFDNGTVIAQAAKDKLASFYDYSQLDRTRMGKLDAPNFLVTHAQTQLLLAEAALRGWTTGSPADFYNAGVTAHLHQLAEHDPGSAVPAAAITTYLAKNPYVAAKGLELINTQYWVASFLNGPETFANFRRSGFPTLKPNPYPGKEIKGDFMRRLTYPDSELSVNRANLTEAITRQGSPDTPDVRVWWDKL